MSQSNKQIVLDFLELAFASRTADAIALLHPDQTWWVAGHPARLKVAGLKDRVQSERLLGHFSKALPAGMRMQVHGVTAEGERVAVEVEAEGDWFDGRRYHNRYHFLIEVREGLVFKVHEYMDTLHLSDLMRS